MRQPTASPFRSDIEGLRAVAVLFVLLFHFGLTPAARGGFMGVDVFFVISGFLITGNLSSQQAAGTLRLRGFYAARVRRLAPALVATLAMTGIAGVLLLFPGELVELGRQLAATQTYLANFYYWRNVNYFGLSSANVFLLHTWSLAVEEQFYLLFPLLLIVLHSRARGRIGQVVALAGVLSFALQLVTVHWKPEATFYLLPCRAWELLAGAVLALALPAARPLGRTTREAGAVAGSALLVGAVFAYNPGIAFPGAFSLLPVVGTVLLLQAGASGTTAIGRLLSLAPMRYVGRISYPLYLVHWPIHVFAHRLLPGHYDLAWRVGMFALSIAVAAAIYHFVEAPVRAGRVLATPRALVSAYAGALVATGAILVGIFSSHGLPGRFPAEVVRLASYAADHSPPLSDCEFARARGPIRRQVCAIGVPGRPARWLIYGDSHAWAMYAAFDTWLKQRNESAAFIFRHGCPPVTSVHLFRDTGDCAAFNEQALEFVAATPDLRSVILVSTWREASEGFVSTSEDHQPTRAESIALFDNAFGYTVRALHGMGRQVYVWGPLPGAKGNVPDAMALARLTHLHMDIAWTRAHYLREFAFLFRDIERDGPFLAGTIDVGRALCVSGRCVSGRCAISEAGRPLYFDGSHPTASAAPFIVGVLDDAFAPPGAHPAAPK